ncbi:MAG: ribosomal protein S18 acetylase RimI-like enzyme [Verrucomicrobiales bacterium]|jgi:ribosomal protein S18 acetylase RimI-like enzyme
MEQQAFSTVSYLEMRSVTDVIPKNWPQNTNLEIMEAVAPQWWFNRFLYQTVGQQWKWTDKLTWTDEQWAEYVEAPEQRTFVAYCAGEPAGYVELLLQENGTVEIVYFGLMPEFLGLGIGGAFLSEILQMVWKWQPRPQRIWLHTCSEDHPAALANYLARGMHVYRTEKVPLH